MEMESTNVKFNGTGSYVLLHPHDASFHVAGDAVLPHVGRLLPAMDYLVTEESTINASSVASVSMQFTVVEIIWIVLFSVMLSVAISGNIVIIWIIACHRRMRTVTNYFLLNLAVADLTMAALNGAPNFVYMLRNDWIFGTMLCIVNNFMANWTVASCVFTMTAISVDRWIAIVRPLEPRMTKTAAWMAILGIWIGSAVLASPSLKFTQLIQDDTKSRTYCIIVWPDGMDPNNSTYELGYNLCLFVLTYLIPITAMAICYGSMSIELWFTQVGEITQRQINSMISKRKVVRMFIVVVATFAICWLPYHGYFIYMHLDKNIVFKKWIQHLYLSFYFLAMSQSSINPIIVISMNSRFRNYIWDMFFNCCSCQEEGTPRNVHYIANTPPLLRRYSQSCSRSKSGTNEDKNPGVKSKHYNHQHHHRTHQNAVRKNMYVTNGREVFNLGRNNLNQTHVHEFIGGSHTSPALITTRATYC